MVISMAIRVIEGGSLMAGPGARAIETSAGRLVGWLGRRAGVSMDTSCGLEQREARGAMVERMVWTVSRQALERVDLECVRQAKKWSPYGSKCCPHEHG